MPCREYDNSFRISKDICRIIIIFDKDMLGMMGYGLNDFCLYDSFHFVIRYDTGCGFCNTYGGLSKFHCKVYQDVVCRKIFYLW